MLVRIKSQPINTNSYRQASISSSPGRAIIGTHQYTIMRCCSVDSVWSFQIKCQRTIAGGRETIDTYPVLCCIRAYKNTTISRSIKLFSRVIETKCIDSSWQRQSSTTLTLMYSRISANKHPVLPITSIAWASL